VFVLIEAVTMAKIEIIMQPFAIITVFMRYTFLSDKGCQLVGEFGRTPDHGRYTVSCYHSLLNYIQFLDKNLLAW